MPQYLVNDSDRCYHCKIELFAQIEPLGGRTDTAVVVDGSNRDDSREHRPGIQAALDRYYAVESDMESMLNQITDGDVDLDDYYRFRKCRSGPDTVLAEDCEYADFECDGDVDLVDFSLFAQHWQHSC